MRFENKFVGLSVKQILTEELGFSRRAVTALKAHEKGIMINGERVTVRATVKPGDVLEILSEDEFTRAELSPSEVMPDIIYEDECTVAINKPPYMPTHQSQGHFYDTLANSLANYYAKAGRPFVFRSVNRLDRNTSGIVLVAKNRLAASRLSSAMKEKRIKKTYLAILDGELDSNSGKIVTYIRRQQESIILREVCEEREDAKLAITHYRVLATKGGKTLVQAYPETGRTHQLRVHFSHMGAQILGDDLYGEPSELISRHALHAHSLSFPHPETGEYVELIAPLPEDMADIVQKLFGEEIAYGRAFE